MAGHCIGLLVAMVLLCVASVFGHQAQAACCLQNAAHPLIMRTLPDHRQTSSLAGDMRPVRCDALHVQAERCRVERHAEASGWLHNLFCQSLADVPATHSGSAAAAAAAL